MKTVNEIEAFLNKFGVNHPISYEDVLTTGYSNVVVITDNNFMFPCCEIYKMNFDNSELTISLHHTLNETIHKTFSLNEENVREKLFDFVECFRNKCIELEENPIVY